MVAEQLERSILERKERDELHAIASAMSLKPTARSKKADIIDLILRATGVETTGAGTAVTGPIANGSGTKQGPPAAGPAQHASADTPAEDGRRTAGRAKDGATAEGGDAAAAPAPRSRAARSPRRSAAATQLELGADLAAAAEHVNGTANGAEASGDGQVATTPERSPGSREPAANGSNGSQREAPRRDVAPSSARSVAGDRAGGERAAANGAAHGLAAAGAPSAEASAEAVVGAPAAPAHPGGGTGSDLGNRRGRRRRGRDRERGDAPSSAEPAAWQGELVPVKGLLDLREEGYGFLRTSGYLASQRDVYVSVSQARRFALRKGDAIEGACRPAGASEKYPALIRIDTVGGLPADEARNRPRFEDLTPLFPDEKLRLEVPGDPANPTARIVDLVSPIGKGQRGMIVSPSKAGKTTILKQIAHSIETNNPDVHLIVLLVDERPEEVTDMRRSVKGEVIASTFDRPADEHTAIAELTIERAKRLVELGKDVVIILDGITRLARAYNLAQPATGRIMSGGVDSGALYPPKRFYGAARNIEEGGSLTILATALIETGSKMDDVIFEEFKGTGNMELRLDRKLAERRLYPAIDVNASSTRHEELLFDRSQLQQVWKLRRVLNALSNEGSAAAGLELLIDKIRTTKSNDEFLAEIAKAPVPMA
jgi:transcription termination factor Rho